MKIVFELNEMPKTCLECLLSNYETTDDGEYIYCIPLCNINKDSIEGEFLKKREDCPLKSINE